MFKSNTITSQIPVQIKTRNKPYSQMSDYKIKQQNYDHNLTIY